MDLDWHFHPFPYLVIISIFHFSLKKSFTNAGALSSWIPGSVPCNRQTHWNGLLCFNGIVTGTIDVDALAAIHGLRSLSFAYNSLTGAIPQLNRLGYLKGYIPPDFFSKMKSLKKANNKFTGGIPPSLAELPRLSELHLEKNQFSGSIPPIDQPTLMSFNVSNDKLEGEIPPNLAIFNYSSFDGIDHLCGDKSGRGCENTAQTSSESPTAAVIIFRMRRRDKIFDVIENRSNGNAATAALEVQVSLSNRSKGMGATKKMGSSRKGSNNGKGGVGELVIVNTEKGAFGLPDLMKASAEVLGNGGMGSSYPDEKPLVYEYMPRGSLLYLLHGDRGPSHAELNWSVRLKIVQGIAEGLGYLHTKLASSHLPHGNLKSSNLFLSDDSEPCIAFRIWSSSPDQPSNVGSSILFGYKAPEAAQHGIIIVLEILTGKFPSQYLNNAKGGTDVVQRVESAISDGRETELLDPEIASSTNSLGQMRRLLGIGAACVERNPEQRASDIQEADGEIELLEETWISRDHFSFPAPI
ncbi:pollen receptor kinase [Salix suchowensis]|nr:pollen receptor kinase [Salix suchowensis]